MDLIMERRSVRSYSAKPVSAEAVTALLRAAMAAPSACNQQPWRFTVVRRQDLKERLAAASPFAGFAAQAPVILVPAFRKDCQLPEYAPVDTSAAVENLLLAAVQQGLGAVWLGVYPRPERMAAVAKILQLPPEEAPFAMVAVGYPKEQPQPVHPLHADWIRELK